MTERASMSELKKARDLYDNDNVTVEPNSVISWTDDGYWVQAWVFVPSGPERDWLVEIRDGSGSHTVVVAASAAEDAAALAVEGDGCEREDIIGVSLAGGLGRS